MRNSQDFLFLHCLNDYFSGYLTIACNDNRQRMPLLKNRQVVIFYQQEKLT
jgi:hypothetical protein